VYCIHRYIQNSHWGSLGYLTIPNQQNDESHHGDIQQESSCWSHDKKLTALLVMCLHCRNALAYGKKNMFMYFHSSRTYSCTLDHLVSLAHRNTKSLSPLPEATASCDLQVLSCCERRSICSIPTWTWEIHPCVLANRHVVGIGGPGSWVGYQTWRHGKRRCGFHQEEWYHNGYTKDDWLMISFLAFLTYNIGFIWFNMV